MQPKIAEKFLESSKFPQINSRALNSQGKNSKKHKISPKLKKKF